MAQDRKSKPRGAGRDSGFSKARGERGGERGGAGKPRPGGPRTAGRDASFGRPRPAPRQRDFRRDEHGDERRDQRSQERRTAPYGAGGGEERAQYGDPYRHVHRPERGGRGFTVTLDPDVARVFRGDASVNKALRLVLQLMQVVQGPAPAMRSGPRAFGERDGRGPRPRYQGTAEARGFARKPRFESDEGDTEGGE